jgi:ribosome-associated toxin RatA of RatAB toxin-antitoxin module
MEVRKTVLVTHSARQMFDLIEAAEHYPDFLPWCAAATIVERDDSVVRADVTVDYHGVRFHFRTRNPKRAPEWMAIHLEQGPFHHFEGEWQLTPLGSEGCRIAFLLRYDFSTPLLSRVASHVFERITNTLVDAFVARADALGPAIPVPAAVAPAGAAPAAIAGVSPVVPETPAASAAPAQAAMPRPLDDPAPAIPDFQPRPENSR